MLQTRNTAVAGLFYPQDPIELQQQVDDYLASANALDYTAKALIAPHAGYIYSGAIAASAYIHLRQRADTIHRVVLIGPSHRVAFEGMALTQDDAYRSPLGQVVIDKEAYQDIADINGVDYYDLAHKPEHSLEVQLPFLQTSLNQFKLVPIVVGNATPVEVADVIDRLWGGDETLIVISSDLSHYHDYYTAQRLDQNTSRAIEALQTNKLTHERACGCTPVQGLLEAAKRHGLKAHTVDLRNSGDTAGDRNRVVGYGAYVFH